MSSLTWLDFSEHDRRKMLEIVDLFREHDTRDELGLGSIRDAFAGHFFPGTSTLMTRARYFLIVPWTYKRLEARKVSSAEISVRTRKAELDLIEVIARSDDKEGNIGKVAKRALKRTPSSVYWQGLGIWGIRTFRGSQSQYHRSLDRFYQAGVHHVNRSLEKDGEHDELAVGNWHGGLVGAPDGFPESVSLRLNRREAEYLCDRIRLSPGSAASLLAELVARRRQCDDVTFAWEHPHVGGLPATMRALLEHARKFSEMMLGAVLLYNLILSEQTKRDDNVHFFQREFGNWCEMLDDRQGAFSSWDRPVFWSEITAINQRIPAAAREFTTAWCDLAIPGDRRRLRESSTARELIKLRERRLKKNLARIDSPAAQQLWGGSSGAGQLDFRWGVTQGLLRDLFAGEARDAKT